MLPHSATGLGWPEVGARVSGVIRELGWPLHPNDKRVVSRETTELSFPDVPDADGAGGSGSPLSPRDEGEHQAGADGDHVPPGAGGPVAEGGAADDQPVERLGLETVAEHTPAGGAADDPSLHEDELPALSDLDAATSAAAGSPDAASQGDARGLGTADVTARAGEGAAVAASEDAQPTPAYDGPAAPRDYSWQPATRAERRTAPTLPRPAAPRVITVANQKGGVGKTTTAVNLAACLAQGGLRVLVIDTDPQGNASTALGIDHRQGVPSIYEVLVEETPLAEVVQECPDIAGLYCAPATIDLAGAEIELISFVARETRLQRAVDAYIADAGWAAPDYVLIDCPPSLGLLTLNAFVAGREVLIPIQCEYYALEGLSMLLKNIEMIQRHLNPKLHLSSILLTMYDGRTRLSSQVADEVRAHFPELVFKTRVPRSVRISEAPSHGVTVMTYDPTSTGALSYAEAAAELASMGGAR